MNFFRILFPLFFIVCIGFGCEKPAAPAAKNPVPLSTGEMTVDDTAAYRPLYVHPLLADAELNSPNTALGGFGKILPQPMERMETQLLTQSYWVMEFYHDSYGSGQQRLNGQGQWLKFKSDGTFIGGHWDRQTHAGAWYILFDGPEVYLTLDSNVDRQDAKWHIQAINGERNAMGWVRTPDFGPRTPRAIQAKMIELYDMPTKAQFGVQ